MSISSSWEAPRHSPLFDPACESNTNIHFSSFSLPISLSIAIASFTACLFGLNSLALDLSPFRFYIHIVLPMGKDNG